MLGTFGKLGSYSLDFFMIVTAGEGGAIVTNNELMYRHVDSFSEYGHAHHGNIFRTSELHAVVASAQLRKTHHILARQSANHAYMTERFRALKELSFKYIPDKEGSCTFLSFFMPSQQQAHAVFKELGATGVPRVQY